MGTTSAERERGATHRRTLLLHSEHLQLTWQRRRAGLWIQTDMSQDPVDDKGVVEEGQGLHQYAVRTVTDLIDAKTGQWVWAQSKAEGWFLQATKEPKVQCALKLVMGASIADSHPDGWPV